jgi:restriction system protein
MDPNVVPPIRDLLWPTLLAVRELGGSAGIRDINERAMTIAQLNDEQRASPHGPAGGTTEVEYRLRWARTNLKTLGALENSSHGVWAVTEYGRTISHESLATGSTRKTSSQQG